jgi:hypothetical protein
VVLAAPDVLWSCRIVSFLGHLVVLALIFRAHGVGPPAKIIERVFVSDHLWVAVCHSFDLVPHLPSLPQQRLNTFAICLASRPA